MIPQKLTIKGIYSYQTEQIIDFEILTSSQLFGVFGAVGSGKSTLLEAISFALYGETERLGKRDNLTYNMMNLKSDELFIDFEFENYDTKKYRFIVEGKRNSKRFEEVKAFQRRAFVFEHGQWNPLESTSAEQILGLSYDNFRRTIIIPQGKFQEFLQLKDKERTEMLKEIFNLSKFEFFDQINALKYTNDKEKENLLGQLVHFNELNEEVLVELAANYENSVNVNTALKKELELISAQEKSLSALKESFARLSAKKEELLNHQKGEEQLNANENTILQYEYALIHFKDRLAQLDKLTSREQKTTADLQHVKGILNGVTEELKRKENVQKELKTAVTNIPANEKELADLSLLLKINDSKAILKENEENLVKGNLFNTTLNKEIEGLENELKQVEKALAEANEKQLSGSIEQFTELLFWYNEYASLLADYNRIVKEEQEEITVFNKRQNEVGSELKSLIIEAEILEESQLLTLIDTQKNELLNLKKEEQFLTEQRTEFKVKQELEKWSSQLEDGQPCLLCGSLDHPNVTNLGSVNTHILAVENELSVIKLKIELNESNLFKLNKLTDLIVTRKERLSLFAELKKVASNKLRLKEESFKKGKYLVTEVEQVKKDFEVFKQQETIINSLKNKRDKQNEELNANFKKREQYKIRFEEIEVKSKTAQLEVDTYRKQLLVLTPENFTDNNTIQKQIEALTASIQQTKNKLETVELAIQELTKTQIIQEQTIKTHSEQQVELVKEINAENKLLAADLATSAFKSIAEIKETLALIIDLEALKKKVSDYKLTAHTLLATITQLEEDLKGKTFKIEEFKIVQLEVAEKTKALELANENRIKQENNLLKAQKDIDLKQKLTKQLTQLELREENIKTLRRLFAGSGFVNYISSVYLQNLCNEANVRFHQLTRQQLKLEINDRNEFLIRDYLNEGKVRSIKTLSGGQLFQASLSLALALAESIQQQHKAKQNFFFLDEGFGSQDKESLQIVFESLKALRKENRIVGVISHVEELQQEITTYLEIKKDNDTGSKVFTSY